MVFFNIGRSIMLDEYLNAFDCEIAKSHGKFICLCSEAYGSLEVFDLSWNLHYEMQR